MLEYSTHSSPRSGIESRQNRKFLIENLSVEIDQKPILKNLSFEVFEGDFYFIIGPTGSGKTTLLKTIQGELNYSKGKILAPESGDDFVVWIRQRPNFLEKQSIESNLKICFDPHLHSSFSEFYTESRSLFEILGLEGFEKRKVDTLSTGERQIVAIVMGLLSRPSVLLLDEPTSNCDRERASKIYEVLNFYNYQKKMTIVWTSHQSQILKEYTGKAIYLDKGRIVRTGSPCLY